MMNRSYGLSAFIAAITELKAFARQWNELYAAEKFEEMKLLADENVGIANASASTNPTGLIYGRDNYYEGIVQAYRGSSGTEKNLLVMDYENWEYIPLGDGNRFYTIGRYTLQGSPEGVNCWLLHRASASAPWQIVRVINN